MREDRHQDRWGCLGLFGAVWGCLGMFGDVWGGLGRFGEVWGGLRLELECRLFLLMRLEVEQEEQDEETKRIKLKAAFDKNRRHALQRDSPQQRLGGCCVSRCAHGYLNRTLVAQKGEALIFLQPALSKQGTEKRCVG